MEKYKQYVLNELHKQNIVLTEKQKTEIEITDFGLNDFEKYGLGIYTYVNNDFYCAKELVMLPNQICPEHRHPSFDNYEGKQETFRCRKGIVYLYVDLESEVNNDVIINDEFTCKKKIVLHPGEQFTIPRNTKHWFQAGEEGAIISEFSTRNVDEKDVFTNEKVKRV